jgi:hypothetical protein
MDSLCQKSYEEISVASLLQVHLPRRFCRRGLSGAYLRRFNMRAACLYRGAVYSEDGIAGSVTFGGVRMNIDANKFTSDPLSPKSLISPAAIFIP